MRFRRTAARDRVPGNLALGAPIVSNICYGFRRVLGGGYVACRCECLCLCALCIKLLGAVEIVNSVDDVFFIFIFIFRFVCVVSFFDFSSCGRTI